MALVASIVLGFLVLLVPPADAWGQVSFTPLGDLGGLPPFSKPLAVSPDGSVVVGYSRAPLGFQAFRWEGGAMTPLGLFPDTVSPNDLARGVSAGASSIVGRAETSAGPLDGALWLADANGLEPLDLGPGEAWGISANGAVIVGQRDLSPVRWDAQTLEVDFLIPDPADPNMGTEGLTLAVSSGGSVSVGQVSQQAFRAEGPIMQRLQGLDPNAPEASSIALDVSGDGSVIVGSIGGLPQEAFRWIKSPVGGAGGVGARLGDLWALDTDSRAYGISADDGSIVVGRSFTDALHYEAFVWSKASGMLSLKAALEGAGLDLTGWVLTQAQDISSNGHTIVGWGTNPAGDVEGWVAVLPSLPASAAEVCGDVNDDDVIDLEDVGRFQLALADPGGRPLPLAGQRKCTVFDTGSPRPCELLDLVVLRRHLASSGPGIAAVCQAVVAPNVCGDVTNDTLVRDDDAHALRFYLAAPGAWPLPAPDKCTVIDTGAPRPCEVLDLVVLRRALRVPVPLGPGISPVCSAVLP